MDKIMAKKIKVIEFLSTVGVLSDDIPVIVKHGTDVICKSKSLRWLEAHGTPYELEAKLKEIVISRDSIVIQIQPRDYSTKI